MCLSISDFPDLPNKEVKVNIIEFPWDLVKFNEQELIVIIKNLSLKRRIILKDYTGVYLLNPKVYLLGRM